MLPIILLLPPIGPLVAGVQSAILSRSLILVRPQNLPNLFDCPLRRSAPASFGFIFCEVNIVSVFMNIKRLL